MPVDELQRAAPPEANVPSPPSERGVWLLASGLALLGAAVLAAALIAVGRSTPERPAAAPPAVPVVAATPAPSAASAASVPRPSRAQQRLDASRLVGQTQTHIATRWIEGFYPIYAVAQSTFAV